MRRIRIFFLLETLLIALAITPAEAVPVQGPDGYFYEVVPTPVTWPTARAAARARAHRRLDPNVVLRRMESLGLS